MHKGVSIPPESITSIDLNLYRNNRFTKSTLQRMPPSLDNPSLIIRSANNIPNAIVEAEIVIPPDEITDFVLSLHRQAVINDFDLELQTQNGNTS